MTKKDDQRDPKLKYLILWIAVFVAWAGMNWYAGFVDPKHHNGMFGAGLAIGGIATAITFYWSES